MKFLLKQFVLPRQKKTKTNEELTNSVGTLRYKIQYLHTTVLLFPTAVL